MPKERVLIVGGGIAGISAALRLIERGLTPIILETRTKLGGRATSFEDVRTGRVLDNCQHIALGCCTNYLDLVERMGMSAQIEWHDDIHWIEPSGRTSVMRPSSIAGAPAHYGASFAHMKFLSARQKWLIARTMFRILRTDRGDWARETFHSYLNSIHSGPLTEQTIALFWEPIVISACNLSVRRVAASCALHVMQEGFLATKRASAMGVPAVPLAQLYDGAVDLISRAGGEVRLSTGVEYITNGAIRTTAGGEIRCEKIICAVPFERALKIVDPEIQSRGKRFEMMKRIEHSPILGVHLHFDRRVLGPAQATLVGMGTQWIFAKNAEDGGQMIHAVVSGADEWVGLEEQTIVDRVLSDIKACLPNAEDAELISARAVKEKRATIAPTPECEANRPGVLDESGGGLVLAADYVDTGWPSTMEGATRAGYMAAAAAVGEAVDSLLVPPLRPDWGARVLGGRSIGEQAAIADVE